jgi:hypothetical protein
MRRIVLAALAGALIAAGAPAKGSAAPACASGFQPSTIDGRTACLRHGCSRSAVVRHHRLRRRCLGHVLWRQSIARR